VIGALDIGGTHVTAARVDPVRASVEARTRCRIALPAEASRSELLERVVGAARAVAGRDVRAWGVAAPGPFDYERGISEMRHKLVALHGVDLRAELAVAVAADPARIRFLNDAYAFGLGEWWTGAARGHARVVGITLGTGLGSAFLADGRIVDSGPAVPPDGSLHVVPFRGGAVEDRISRRGLLARYDGDVVDVEQVAERARGGDERAAAAFHEVASDLADLVAPWLRTFGATCLVVGGSIARAWDLIAPVLRRDLSSVESLAVVTVAARLDEAALLGAALHVAGSRP
jgi:glucokinase